MNGQIESIEVQLRSMNQRVKELEAELEAKETDLQVRFQELATLTRRLEEQREEVEALKGMPPWRRWFFRLDSHPRFPVVPWYRRWLRSVRRRIPQRAVNHIEASALFDAKWYMARYPELQRDKLARSRPALHYLKKGGFEGYDPGPNFDSAWYLKQYPDLKASGVNPLLHYVLHGADEGRHIRPHRLS